MDENTGGVTINVGGSAPQSGGNSEVTPTSTGDANGTVSTPTQSPERSFAQSQVNDLIRQRLTRLYSRYGANNIGELDALVNKSRSYDIMNERYAGLQKENAGLNEKIAFMSANINPKKYDEVRTYFKGKEALISEGALLEEVKNHPEWLNVTQNHAPVTTIKTLGTPTPEKSGPDDAERAQRLLGVRSKF